MTQLGHQPRFGQHFEGPILVEVNDNGIAWFSGTDERHDTVAASIGVLHHAGIAIDGEGRGRCVHADRVPTG